MQRLIKRAGGSRRTRFDASDFLRTVGPSGSLQRFQVKDFCRAYAVTQDTLTRLAGFSPRAVANWAQGRRPSPSTERRLTEMNRIFQALEKLISKAAIGPWLKEPNPAFDGSTPLQVIERGETDRIWRMIYQLKSGEPG